MYTALIYDVMKSYLIRVRDKKICYVIKCRIKTNPNKSALENFVGKCSQKRFPPYHKQKSSFELHLSFVLDKRFEFV